MGMQPKATEEFLWKLHEFLGVVGDVHDNLFTRRSLKEELQNEWRALRHAYERKQQKKSFSQFISQLRQRGYVKIPRGQSLETIQLTEKGIRKALQGRMKEQALKPMKDGKMIMLMFDIPKEKERIRQMFRGALARLDYQMFQKSVWISDKDVLKETERVIRECDLLPCVSLFVIEKVAVRK